MSSALTSQRFCLRWNNHQSNLLTVFDQLLHDESFVDVTLAVEGRFLRAHKMVLSACSPYFQALFVGHPDKHPIVILKDVPYCDMRSLLDFMYRGEVSVDQERLTAFLKVAESLRIKGLTEVNEDRCEMPTITSSLLSSAVHSPSPPVPPPPPHLHRIHTAGHKRPAAPATAANPLLGSALTAPKRKRGRPRKLSGSSPGPGAPPNLLPAAPAPAAAALSGGGLVDSHHARGPTALLDGNDLDSSRLGGDSIVVQGSPEMLEVKMGTLDFQQNSPPPAPTASSTPSASGGGGSSRTDTENGQASPELSHGTSGKDLGTRRIKEEPEPAPGPSSQDPGQAFMRSGTDQEQQAFALACTPEEEAAPGAAAVDRDDCSSLPEDENELITLSPTSDADLDVEEGIAMERGEGVSELALTQVENLEKEVGLAENGNSSSAEMSADKSSEGYNLKVKSERMDEGSGNGKKGQDVGDGEARDGGENVDGGEMGDMGDDGEDNASQMSSTRSFCMREADNLFRCKVCQKTYTHISNFCRHYLTTHKQRRQVFGCPACGKEFTRRDNMMTHLKGVHRHILMPF
ncbi:Protein tramtrack, beta isoform [Gryllus bimaculatus]|nr:Protein tramtrack, beta isoform [Gryllus bimaculatus]